jgi:S-adenosylmethionine:tRNA ribosyltransferase-isomerase
VLSYSLPKERIAQFPAEPRDSSRLLVVDREQGTVPFGDSLRFISHRIFHDLPELLRAGDCLVLNDTRVIPARLFGCKTGTGGKVELLLLERLLRRPSGPLRNDEKCAVYRCLGQPARSLKPGTRLAFDHGSLQAEVIAWEKGERLVRFEGRGAEQALLRLGEVPLPPYIDRPVEPRDADWYQTVYAREAGAVAAPTAGLHFTPGLMDRIRAKGIRTAFFTLHVGWGTFKPVGEAELKEGRLHAERYRIPAETVAAIEQTKANGGRVIAVGTTAVRTLETFALRQAQGERSLDGEKDLFIRPGFQFRVVDGLVTNFHLPGTSLLLLVSAFAGEERIQAAYREAVDRQYRFYSYGDAMLIA